METTNTNHTEQNGTNTAEKMMNDTSKGMMDMFTKNLNLVSGYYSNLFNSFSNGNKGLTNNNGSSTNFMNYDLTKLFSNPFGGMGNSFSNQSLPVFNSLYQQMMDYNNNLFSALSKGSNTTTDWSEIGKKQEAMIGNRLEATKNMRRSIIEAYTKQLDSVNESSKKMIEETTNQFNLLMKQNQKLWVDMFAMFQTPQKAEEKIAKDTLVKEPIVSDLKKRTTFAESKT